MVTPMRYTEAYRRLVARRRADPAQTRFLMQCYANYVSALVLLLQISMIEDTIAHNLSKAR